MNKATWPDLVEISLSISSFRRLSVFAVVAALAIGPMMATEEPVADDPPREELRLTRLQGTARIDRRHRVIGAVAKLQLESDLSRIYLTSTDEDGDFLLDSVPEGTYELTLSRSGFEPIVKTGVRLKFPFRAVVEVTMERSDHATAVVHRSDSAVATGSIAVSGVARDRDGGPIAEARIRFVHPEGQADPRSVQTAGDGAFEAQLSVGLWELEVDGVGFLPIDVVLEITHDVELKLRLVRQPADYKPSPLELMPPEILAPPPGLEPRIYKDDARTAK